MYPHEGLKQFHKHDFLFLYNRWHILLFMQMVSVMYTASHSPLRITTVKMIQIGISIHIQKTQTKQYPCPAKAWMCKEPSCFTCLPYFFTKRVRVLSLFAAYLTHTHMHTDTTDPLPPRSHNKIRTVIKHSQNFLLLFYLRKAVWRKIPIITKCLPLHSVFCI